MSSDDDDGSVIIIQKAKQAVEKVKKHKVSAALIVVAFVLGAWIF